MWVIIWLSNGGRSFGCRLTFESGLCTARSASNNDNGGQQQQQQQLGADGIPAVRVHNGAAFPWDPSESFGADCAQPSLLANVSALMAAWRPGSEGGPAVLNLLSGAANPSGE